MQKGVSKSDIGWLLVKLVGVYLVYAGIVGLLTAFVVRSNLEDSMASLSERYKNIPKYKPAARASIPFQGIYWIPLMSLGIGGYLLASGRVLHRVLMMVPLDSVTVGDKMNDDEELVDVKGLSAVEHGQFKEWLVRNPEMMKRSLVDAVALFRDAQKSDVA
ncbi:MAG: hypothetical protein ACSHX6_15060 [Akkermansiaceae bacterium]